MWGRWTHFDPYFSNGLKPPTRIYTCIQVFWLRRILEQEAQKHTDGPTHTDILRESYHVKQANRLPFPHHWVQYTFLMLIDTTFINYWRWDSCSTLIMRSFQDTPGLGRAGIFCRKDFYLSWSHFEQWKKTGWLGFTRDYTTQLVYMGTLINHSTDPAQPTSIMESRKVYFVAHLKSFPHNLGANKNLRNGLFSYATSDNTWWLESAKMSAKLNPEKVVESREFSKTNPSFYVTQYVKTT